jgi:hypothetical protein
LFVHGTKCSGTEQNVLVREPNVLACRLPPAAQRLSILSKASSTRHTVRNFSRIAKSKPEIHLSFELNLFQCPDGSRDSFQFILIIETDFKLGSKCKFF